VRRRRVPPSRKLMPWDIAAVRKRRWAGETMFSIAIDYDVSTRCIRRQTADIGHSPRIYETKVEPQQALRLRSHGMSAADIAERYGVSKSTVWRALQRASA
jgi:predicted DNA-binding protein (UPF0251 family)